MQKTDLETDFENLRFDKINKTLFVSVVAQAYHEEIQYLFVFIFGAIAPPKNILKTIYKTAFLVYNNKVMIVCDREETARLYSERLRLWLKARL